MTILARVEDSLRHFHPKNHRELIVYNIARQFDDLPRLATYLNVCERHPKKVLLEAARLALLRSAGDSRAPGLWFHELLESWDRKEAA
jgi:hypothetical protein